MTAGDRIKWCRSCHHAIEPATRGEWGHVSDDDWVGSQSECQCAWNLTPCSPLVAHSRNGFPRARPRLGSMRGVSASYVVYDEVQLFSDGGMFVTGVFNGELTEYGKYVGSRGDPEAGGPANVD